MTVTADALKMLQELSDAPGACGFEDEVVKVARRWAEPIGQLKEDFLRNRYTVYADHSVKKIPQAIAAFPRDWPAKLSRSSSGAIITMAGKLERMYKLEVGVRRPGSISFIRIIPLEAVPVKVPKLIRKNSCSKPLKHSLATFRIYT